MKMSTEMSRKRCYTSVACNRYSHCIDCKNALICFAAKHSVAIYCFQRSLIIQTLNGHKSHVNSVKWVSSDDSLLISSSADKTAIIWDLNDLNNYKIKFQLIGHKESVIVSRCYQIDVSLLLTISTSTDKRLIIWLNDKPIRELSVNNFVFDFKICKNKHIFDDILLMTVGANETIDFYQLNGTNYELKSLIEVKGHEDWIRSIDVFEEKNDSLMMATSSQDCFIRVHRIQRTDRERSDINGLVFSMQTNDNKQNYSIKLETVLAGHEGWVSEVRWHLKSDCLQLLSVSMDKTMVLWRPPTDDHLDDLWVECVRVGEMGGNTLGFLGCASSPELNLIIGHSFNGALHLWKCCDDEWRPSVAISGHFGDVTDIAWDPKGEYVLSCSADQTTRLHSVWVSDRDVDDTWHEMARPQIHGYDMKCIAVIDRQTFASGADEKVVRIFKGTQCFARSLKQISNIDIDFDPNDEEVAHSATVATLGLSNTAVYSAEQVDHNFKPTVLDVPPTEETLLQNTLWPEVHKLYGHVYEIFSLAANSCGTVIASASKASKAEHSDVILWDIREAKQIGRLSSHQLTVTRIRFSSDDRFILSASRDRSWALFERPATASSYSRIAFSDKKTGIHSRIIWDCAFTPDNRLFITVSRDKSALFWSIGTDLSPTESCLGPVSPMSPSLTLTDSITSVDICNTCFANNYLIAFGLENGNICLYFWNNKTFWSHLMDINDSHTLTVNRILFSPKVDKQGDGWKAQFGSCSADHMLHIFDLFISCKE